MERRNQNVFWGLMKVILRFESVLLSLRKLSGPKYLKHKLNNQLSSPYFESFSPSVHAFGVFSSQIQIIKSFILQEAIVASGTFHSRFLSKSTQLSSKWHSSDHGAGSPAFSSVQYFKSSVIRSYLSSRWQIPVTTYVCCNKLQRERLGAS